MVGNFRGILVPVGLYQHHLQLGGGVDVDHLAAVVAAGRLLVFPAAGFFPFPGGRGLVALLGFVLVFVYVFVLIVIVFHLVLVGMGETLEFI